MSTLYPDLPLTSYPSSLDTFTTWLNVTASDGPLIQQYITAMNAGNQTLANQILTQISSASQKIITATDLNTMTQAIQAVERFYLTDIQPYIQNQQESWLNTINQFSYQGTWQAGTNYVTNNIVSYTVSGVNLLFIATSNPPTGTVPTNTTYWRVLTIQGQQGTSGAGLSYRQEWSASKAYQTNDAVTYNAAIWMATQPSQNQIPSEGSAYWKLVMTLEATTYPIQPTEPTNLDVGGLWLNTQGNPTQYYYLEALTNPAQASQIIYGYEAYDEEGNLLTGSLPVPTSLAVTTNPNQMTYMVGQSFDPTGMVVTATYSDGSEVEVDNYTYSPTGALTVQDTTISISYTDVGTTVSTTLTITVINVSTTLNNNSWDIISQMSNNGTASSYWAVGDAKQITINATIGTKSYSNYQPWVYILGFNHNASREGNNRIHFGCFQSAQSYSATGSIALDDSSYGSSTSTNLAFHMNTTNTNSGGWQSSVMRTQVLDSDATSATSGGSNSFLAALPSDLQSVLKQCTKYTDNVGNSSGNASGNISATQDWIWLLSEYEVQGATTYANTYEANYQQQYQYYANGNSKIKYRQRSAGTAAWWWNRSPRASNSTDFCEVRTGGSAGNAGARVSYGLAPGFCV